MTSVSEALEQAVRKGTEGKDVAIAFSGGLDSGLVAALTNRYARKAVLYTVGCGEAYDVRMARSMSEKLGMEWALIEMDDGSIESALRDMISVTGTTDPLTLAFEMPPFCVCRACKESLVIGGQGADEVFAGYSKYIGLGEDMLRVAMKEDMDRLKGPTMDHETKVACHFGKTVLYPYLDSIVSETVGGLDFGMLMPKDGASRKNPLREAASELGYPFIADKPKKAAQYGSGTMDSLHRTCKRKGVAYSEFISSLCKELQVG
jgi:asparagine synthase (glutamine-hydrolysing)